MISRKFLYGFGVMIVGCIIGLAMPALAGGGGAAGGGRGGAGAGGAGGAGGRGGAGGGGRGGAAIGTTVSATYKGLTTTRSYQPMATTAPGPTTAGGPSVITTTYPAVKSLPLPDDVRRSYNLDPFYQKYLMIRGIMVVGSIRTSDWALLEAAYTFDHQFAHSPQWVRDGFLANKVRHCIIADVEYTMDLPQNRNMGRGDYNDRRSRGLGGYPMCSSGEENLLNLPGDPYGGNGAQGSGENITIHEFSHTTGSMIRDLQRRGIGYTPPTSTSTATATATGPDPTVAGGGGGGRGRGGRGDPAGSWGQRMDAAYAKAMAPGGRINAYNQQRGGQVYAGNTWQEYWAEGAQAWFDNANPGNSGGLSVRNDVKTKDPDLAALLKEIYGDEEWRYIKTTAKKPDNTPLRPKEEMAHLEGIDAVRNQFPRFNFENSPRIIEVRLAALGDNQQANDHSIGPGQHDIPAGDYHAAVREHS